MTREELFARAADRYGAEPEYLWASAPSYAVLRRQDNRKWFAIVMDIPRCKLEPDGDDIVDIVNVRCGPVLGGSLREQPGYFPAWHMNKQNWISILLDGTVHEDELLPLLELSYDLAGPKRKKKPVKEDRDDHCEGILI